jgi:hypothetical protein
MVISPYRDDRLTHQHDWYRPLQRTGMKTDCCNTVSVAASWTKT